MILPLSAVTHDLRAQVGGKAAALASLARRGVPVPATVCITGAAYRQYLEDTRLEGRIRMELGRKELAGLRWEELWDTALRIRNHVRRTPLGRELAQELRAALADGLPPGPVVVRSSALDEDGATASFAGLHDSFVGLEDLDEILLHVRLVWASLWSDRALLYRRELGLDPSRSAMAVLVQELVAGSSAGVAFGQSPVDPQLAVIEAVHGLNQGLVDGTVEPDRWELDRQSGRLLVHTPATRLQWVQPTPAGAALTDLPAELADRPPLSADQVAAVRGLLLEAEACFGRPQDLEWTYRAGELVALQARPITTGPPQADGDDARPWYLSLHRSLANLHELRATIETEILPGMTGTAERLAARPLVELDNRALAAEIEHRQAALQHWVEAYWRDCIPFAHGMRLFGVFYNDTMQPEDPFAFVDLLTDTPLAGVERNRQLEELAAEVRGDPDLATALRTGAWDQVTPMFLAALDAFIARFGDLTSLHRVGSLATPGREPLTRLLLVLAGRPPPSPESATGSDPAARRAAFLDSCPPSRRRHAAELLDLARASFRLRDDDNLYLGRVEAEVDRALAVGRSRLTPRLQDPTLHLEPEEILRGLRDPAYRPTPTVAPHPTRPVGFGHRQLVGQPAGPGLARGLARVIHTPDDLFALQPDEVLVCDAIDPTMTFVVPLAAAIVERRGGMLIHGAIIAREYGRPAVTGVPEATTRIATGDELTVDGHLGLVIVTRTAPAS
jgi:pyruvate,water dikinase